MILFTIAVSFCILTGHVNMETPANNGWQFVDIDFSTTDAIVSPIKQALDGSNRMARKGKRKERGSSRKKAETYTLTAYCPCAICCGKCDRITASGTVATQGRTIAVDPNVIPYGTKVHIEGLGTYVAEDCGSGVQGKRIDVFFDSHEEALEFGVQERMVTY